MEPVLKMFCSHKCPTWVRPTLGSLTAPSWEVLARDVAEQGAWENLDEKKGTQQQGWDGTIEQEG